MVKYDVKTLFDFINACDDISTKTSDTTDELEYEINLLNDIDFNDEQYSEYWVNKSSIMKLKLNMDNQIVNIRGNGFALKNVYIVCKWLFYITYNMSTSSNNTLTVNFHNLTIEAVLNRNSIDCYGGGIGLVYCNHPSQLADQTITHFYNCTFNTKMFAAYAGTDSRSNIQDNYSLSDTTSSSTVIINSQFYIKLYLTDACLEATNMKSFLWHKVHNTFFVLDVRACNSRYFSFCDDSSCVLSNTYIVIKKTNKTLTRQPWLRFKCSNDSSTNNFITLDSSVTEDSIVIQIIIVAN